jgi:glucosylceramidase
MLKVKRGLKNQTTNPDRTFMKITGKILLCWLAVVYCSAQQPAKDKDITIYTTAEKTEYRLTRTIANPFVPSVQPLETEICIFVNPKKTFQTFLGIGGAITDAAAEVFAKLSAAKQQELLTAYYDRNNGIGYTLARTSIHSSDFSSESYTYVKEGDKELKTFSIDHDKLFRIPLIKLATENSRGKVDTVCESLESSCIYERE